MKTVYSSLALGCSFISLSYREWLAIQEPYFFDFAAAQEDNHWLFLQNAGCLSAYAQQVKLLRVGDVLYKLDGKQRLAVWSSGKIQPPDSLFAQVFDITEADFLTVNNEARNKQLDVLPPNDAVKLVYADLGLVFTSERLRGGFINDALNIALRGRQRALQDRRSNLEKQEINIKKAITVFRKELMLIDSLNPNPEVFVTGVLAGALIMLGLDKDINEFLKRLNEQHREILNGLHDPVSALIKEIDSSSYRINQQTVQKRKSIDLCKKTIQSILFWEQGRESPHYWHQRSFSGADHMAYIRELKRLKQIDDTRDL